LSSFRADSATINTDDRVGATGSMKDYNKLILGLEYALEM
jgi:hypothetical protein